MMKWKRTIPVGAAKKHTSTQKILIARDDVARTLSRLTGRDIDVVVGNNAIHIYERGDQNEAI